MIPSNQRVELIANKNLGFRAVTDRISSNQLNLKLTGLTDGHKYAVETKEQPQQSLNIIERQTPILSGSTSANIDINLPKTDYVVGRTYYLAVRDLNDDIEVIQASFHIDENLTDGGDSVVIKYLSSQYTVSGNAIDNTNKIQDQEGLIDDIANNAVADAAASSLEVKTYIDNQVATQNEASEISYNNSTSGLTATDVQAAIDEVDGNVDSNDTDISNLQSNKVDKSGSVTQLSDVTSAGSGAIITSSERSNLHNPVTIGTANGLSLSGQTLSLSTATTSVAGALSSTDKTKLDNIESGATNIANDTTDDLSEGSNLYYTDTRVQANRLDQLAKPTSDLDINSNKLTNVTNPTNPQDAATMAFVGDNYVSKISSSTDNAIVRFDGVNGEVQNSGITIDDSNNFTSDGIIQTSSGSGSAVASGNFGIDGEFGIVRYVNNKANVETQFVNQGTGDYKFFISGTEKLKLTDGGEAVFNSTINPNNDKIINVADPDNPQDAATANYVDNIDTTQVLTVGSSSYNQYTTDGTDDNVEIQSAIDQANSNFNSGSGATIVKLTSPASAPYDIGDTIIHKSGVILVGSNSVLKAKNGLDKTVLQSQDFATYSGTNDTSNLPVGLDIYDIAVDGNKANQTSGNRTVEYYTAGNHWVNFTVYDAYNDGIYLESPADANGTTTGTFYDDRSLEPFLKVSVSECNNNGLDLRAHDAIIQNSLFFNNDNLDVILQGDGTNNTAFGTQIHSSHYWGGANTKVGNIQVDANSNLVATGNQIESLYGTGLILNNGGNEIVGNRLFLLPIAVDVDSSNNKLDNTTRFCERHYRVGNSGAVNANYISGLCYLADRSTSPFGGNRYALSIKDSSNLGNVILLSIEKANSGGKITENTGNTIDGFDNYYNIAASTAGSNYERLSSDQLGIEYNGLTSADGNVQIGTLPSGYYIKSVIYRETGGSQTTVDLGFTSGGNAISSFTISANDLFEDKNIGRTTFDNQAIYATVSSGSGTVNIYMKFSKYENLTTSI